MNNDITLIKRRIYEFDLYGCHVTLEKMNNGLWDATVSYCVYNDLGVHIASPQWGEIGTGEEVYLFVLRQIAHAQECNQPIVGIEP